MERDHALERELLDRAQAPNALAVQVLDRLDGVEAKHGNTGWERPAAELIAEAQEEAADIAGWGIGAALQLTEAQRTRLVVAMRLSAVSWRELEELRAELLGA